MKQILAIVLAGMLAGCASQSQQVETGSLGEPLSASTMEAGAATPTAAVERFLETIKLQDIQATSMIWGTDKGPARNQMTRDYQEKAIIIMQCYLAHDTHRVVNDAPGQSGKRIFQVALTNSQRERTTPFSVVQGPRDRWFVESAELEPVKDFCRNPPQD